MTDSNLIDEKDIPSNWVPKDTPLGAPAPPVPHDKPQELSGSLSPAIQHDTSFVGTESSSPRIPRTALMPFGNQANPNTNAAAQSTAKIIATQVVAATPPVTSGGGGTDVDIIAGVNFQPFGAIDNYFTNSDSSGSVPSISTTGLTTGANEIGIVASAGQRGGTGGTPGQSPGAGWTALGNGFWKVFATAGLQPVTQAFSGATPLSAAQALIFLRTNGSVPVFTGHGSGTGGTSNTSFTFTPTAGNSILFIGLATTNASPNPDTYTCTDTAGNIYIPIHAFANSGGQTSEVIFFYAQNVNAVSTTITVTSLNGGLNWFYFEISNVSGLSSGSYTFQSSDLDKLVQ